MLIIVVLQREERNMKNAQKTRKKKRETGKGATNARKYRSQHRQLSRRGWCREAALRLCRMTLQGIYIAMQTTRVAPLRDLDWGGGNVNCMHVVQSIVVICGYGLACSCTIATGES